MTRLANCIVAAIALGCAGTPLSAAESGDTAKRTYLGAGVGYSRLDSEDFTNTSGDLSGSQASWKALVGVKFGPTMSAEAQFLDLGTASRGTDSVRASAWTAALLVNVLGESSISPYGKIGAVYWDTGLRFGGAGVSDTGVDLALGIGVRFMLGERFFLRTEYERFEMKTAEADNISAALVFAL